MSVQPRMQLQTCLVRTSECQPFRAEAAIPAVPGNPQSACLGSKLGALWKFVTDEQLGFKFQRVARC